MKKYLSKLNELYKLPQTCLYTLANTGTRQLQHGISENFFQYTEKFSTIYRQLLQLHIRYGSFFFDEKSGIETALHYYCNGAFSIMTRHLIRNKIWQYSLDIFHISALFSEEFFPPISRIKIKYKREKIKKYFHRFGQYKKKSYICIRKLCTNTDIIYAM